MSEPKPRREWTVDDYRERTEDARRVARFKYAQERIQKIVDGMPPFTSEQLSRLVDVLRSGGPRE